MVWNTTRGQYPYETDHVSVEGEWRVNFRLQSCRRRCAENFGSRGSISWERGVEGQP